MSQTKLKVVTLGEISSGKTSIIYRVLRGQFINSESTIGASFFTYENKDVKYEIWDTAGCERFLSLASIYFRNADIIMLMIDVSSVKLVGDRYCGYEKIEYYLDKLKGDMLARKFKIIVVGTKSDLLTTDELDIIKTATAKKISRINTSIADFVYTSSKNGDGMDELKKRMFECGDEMKMHKGPLEEVVRLEQNITEEDWCTC